jgi:hypothetical protein
MKHSNRIVQFFEENFNEKKCHDLCRQSGFIKRSSSKLNGYEFIKTMILPSDGSFTDSLKGLCKRMKKLNPKADLSSQALCERINNINSSQLMKGVLAELIHQVYNHITYTCPKLAAGLDKFNKILLQDSTVVTLNEHLESEYKGTRRGNNCVKSQVKIDLIHDLGKGLLIDAGIFNGNVPDQNLAGRILDFTDTGDLVIRDLGYFTMLALLAISGKNGYFLSRLKPGVNFYENKERMEQLDLANYLKNKEHLHKNILEISGYLGKEKIPVRLIIYRQTEEITNQRIRAANKHARKKGETMSKSKKLLLHFTMFITNATVEMMSAGIVGTIYRLRWEIELIFKRWKSQLKIDYLKGTRKERINLLILSRICTVVILDLIIGYTKRIVGVLYNVELSEVKLIQYMMRSNEFFLAMAQNSLGLFFEEMEKDIPRMLLKDKRSRKTMREKAFTQETYYGMQLIENKLSA